MDNIAHWVYDRLIHFGSTETLAKYINMFALLLSASIIIYLVDLVSRLLLIRVFSKFTEKSKTNIDNILVSNNVSKNIAHIIPLFVSIEFTPYVFIDFDTFETITLKIQELFFIILTLWIVRSLLNSLKDLSKTLPHLKDKPINSYIQVFMIFAWIGGFMYAYTVITDTSIWKFFTVLGAASAIIILIFKDTILGFVASIQVSINDMVRIGDWITFEKYGADGDVIEINLATVMVQNFDKTITTIPTYALISESFKNWRGMESSGGRRIKRALIIKQGSIKFLHPTEVDDLKKIEVIKPYLEKRQSDIDEYNAQQKTNKDLLLNGRNLTNIGVFRKYIDTYISNHSAINKEMMIMVRQLNPSAQGIPIEIYTFSSDKRWKNYEYIMADIFDHLMAAVPYFKLELFELPDGGSFRNR